MLSSVFTLILIARLPVFSPFSTLLSTVSYSQAAPQGTWSTRVEVRSLPVTQSLSHPSSPPLAHIWGYRLAWKEPTGLISTDTCSRPFLRLVKKLFPSLRSASAIGRTPFLPWCLQAPVGCPAVPGPLLGAPDDVYVEGIQAPGFIWFHFAECRQRSADRGLTSPQHYTAPI